MKQNNNPRTLPTPPVSGVTPTVVVVGDDQSASSRIVARLRHLPAWAYITVALVALVLGCLIAWWLMRPGHPPAPQTSPDNPTHTPSAQKDQPSTDKPTDTNSPKPTPSTPQNTSSASQGVGSGQTGGSAGGTQDTGGENSTGGCSDAADAPGGADSWGGCWPGPSNTGVPSGTALRRVPQDVTSGSGWTWDGADQVVNVTGTGTVIDGLNVSGGFYVTGAGSTIKNSKAKAIGIAGAARSTANPKLTIQDTAINCGNQGGSTGIGDLNFIVLRVNIQGCENGFDVDSDASITDSYIHDLYNSTSGDPHTDGLQSAVGSNLTITHNVFYGFTTGCAYPNDGSCNGTSGININNSSSGPTSSNTTLSKNLLAGGAYALYCPIAATVNFRVLDNHFSKIYSPNVGEFGPSSDCAGEIQSGNVIHEANQPLSLD